MSGKLTGKKIAILVEKGFEQVELEKPKTALEEAGAETHIISPQSGKVKAWDSKDWGKEFDVDKKLEDVVAADYDGLLLPGGVMNPDYLRANEQAVAFVRAFNEAGKPIAAICHGPWTLIEADAVKGRQVTSWPSLRTDLTNAGANWVNEEVVTDKGLVTSRKPEDIPAFNKKMIEEFAEGVHNR
ncbi:DJ-1/PfpI/YhbO family deglycase/protease [Nibribacter ruber]|uniref:DJ-1/PfpI/YhbO family deglycase/protease n=1 Tax=Nibribacter ruber TaxID=2698458 RepID=A0A6P1P2F0_9BACT|nr:type 1 glutamine amidotransferase domain-containing protein [Nibribacter ruber]QHL88560.1 DJ-1/PfpI/YhbO family deglycase/protease [Nibribacter ruber]